MRVLDIVAGVLLIAVGIYCLCNNEIAVMSAALLLGLFTLAAGIAEIVVFAGTNRIWIGSGWLLLEGVLTVIMSLFLLFNQWFTKLSLPFLFALWLLFSGISRFVSSFDLRALGVRAWGWVLALGIILMIAGFVCIGPVAQLCGNRRDHRACVPAGGYQFHRLRLHSQNEEVLIAQSAPQRRI